ncbi:MAG: polysaccharide pyruvyl transferase family protein [Clostridiales bacterium]|jgi:polysaccharide pyruvyl transferase WcaK-like protein|nr:polysaccharide pyruvyl transferase family protein [Clostridiales bacterium]
MNDKKGYNIKNHRILMLGFRPPNWSNLGEDALVRQSMVKLAAYFSNNTEFVFAFPEYYDITPLQLAYPNYKFTVLSTWVQNRPIRILAKVFIYWPKLVFSRFDFIFDIREGDRFSDIYSLKSFLLDSLPIAVRLIMKRNQKLIYLPITIGPFVSNISIKLAQILLDRAEAVFLRDGLSALEMEKYSKLKPVCVTDLAFEHPYDSKQCTNNEKIKIGINASGLCASYKASSSYDNMDIGDYDTLIKRIIIEFQQKNNIEVHLIPHVIVRDSEFVNIPDNDWTYCEKLKDEFPSLILPDKFSSEYSAKSYIASMDFFIGSRMHATIAAVSTGVPTIPIGYSIKFNGLYEQLGYGDYVIDLRYERNVDIVAGRVFNYYQNRAELKEKTLAANRKARELLGVFDKEFGVLLDRLLNE